MFRQLTWRTGVSDVDTRRQFVTNGTLDNTNSAAYRAVNDQWYVFPALLRFA